MGHPHFRDSREDKGWATRQSYTFDYDRSGNRWHQNASPQYTFNSNNRISTGGYGYDAAGNMTNDTFHTYTFDAEERMTGVDNQNTATYNYDALSRRVQQTRSAPYASYTYLYDLAGRRVTDLYNHDWRRTEVYAGGERLGLYMGTTLYFTHTDWLGTERKRTDVNGNEVVHITGLPFGDGQAYSAWDPSQDYFTGQQYDDESNLDHFWFRQYASTQGRWLTPDPAGLAAADLSNPQSLNRYAYVMNNPVAYVDPLGLFMHCDSGYIKDSQGFATGCKDGGGVGGVGGGRGTPDRILLSATEGGGGPANNANNGPGFLKKLNTCVVNNAKNYSIGGAANLTFNTQIPGSVLASNSITDTYLLVTGQDVLLFSAWNGLKSGFTWSAASPIMTNGPNSLTTISPVRGSPQPVLGPGTNYNVSFWGKLFKAGAQLKVAADVGLSGALVLNCSLGQVQ